MATALVAACSAAFSAEPSADEKAIQDSAVKFVDAYNAKDAKQLAELFGTSARVEEADGTIVEGRENIQQAFEAIFQAEPRAAISVSLESLAFLTPEVGVEQGSTEFFPDGDTLTSRSRYLVVHLKKDGQWRMVSVRSFERQVVSNYEYLRQLEWLVGDWADEGLDEIVETSCRWDDDRNFLIQDYAVKREGSVVMRGTQRIGWDPQSKQFRSWIFDSKGGFGESKWSTVDDGWRVQMSGVSAQGDNVSATRVLAPQGSRINVRTTDRMADGESLPDVGFVMVRQAPAPATTVAK